MKKNQWITADTALRLSNYFGTTPIFWLGLQNDFGIEEELVIKKDEVETIEKVTPVQQ